MAANIRYMGTKRQLSPLVADLASALPPGPFMDLFAGVCSVSTEMAKSRNVWTNDAQLMPYYMANSLFRTCEQNTRPEKCLTTLQPHYQRNFEKLCSLYSNAIIAEYAAISSAKFKKLESLFSDSEHASNSEQKEKLRLSLARQPRAFPYRMVSELFSFGYFGILQSIELDSLRYSFDAALENNEISSDQYTYCISALCVAASVCSNTTGHFAQYLSPNSKSFSKQKSQLTKSIYEEFENTFLSYRAIKTKRWRQSNKSYHGDFAETLEKVSGEKRKPSIFYADPPYTADQYSRYYHFLDTLIRYDYPNSVGKGRYPGGRFRSGFSLRSEVQQSFKKLFEGVAACDAAIILSYPDNGLLPESREWIVNNLKLHFSKVDVSKVIPYKHSTMGGSKGPAKNEVNELLFLAA